MTRLLRLFLILLTLQTTTSFAATITVTNGGDAGPGTLRQAIIDAAPGDLINFSGVTTVSLTSGELNFNKGITIDGGVGKVTITRTVTTQFRIFTINGNTNVVTLNNLIITNGRLTSSQAGGIQNNATLTMNNCTLSGNYSIQGGGMQSDYSLTMNNCLVVDNLNRGGIFAGGILFEATDCIIAQNEGHGIQVGGSTVVTLKNCVVSGNTVISSFGDGINFNSTANSTFTNCTFSGNGRSGANLNNKSDKVVVKNCIFSDNTEAAISNSTPLLTSASINNLTSGPFSGGLTNGVNGNIVGQSANHVNINNAKGADNTWFTADDGFSLSPTSPALNTGTNTGIPTTDILGNIRPYNSGVADIGAYEYSQPIPLPTVLTQPVSVAVCTGDGASFTITAKDFINYKWQLNSGSGWTDVVASSIYSGQNTATLLVSNSTGLNAVQYRCFLTNIENAGTNTNAATLTVATPLTISYPQSSYAFPTGSAITPVSPTVSGGLTNSAISVSTFTGIGSGNSDGNATTARFNQPNGGVFDAAGNMYVSDVSNHRIRKITPAGDVTTFAGSSAGFVDATGIAARFFNPTDLTIDAAGNLYVADKTNNKIRKVTPAGVVTTFAGSTSGSTDANGTSAKFSQPQGITIDASGNLYVADASNNRIRKITPAGDVTTVAGSTAGFADGVGVAAQFDNPQRLIVDASGNLLVADTDNNRIRKITPAGQVTTLAGSSQGLANGAGIAAKFNRPHGLVLLPSGDLLVADYENHQIRKVSAKGEVSPYAGSTSGLVEGVGPAVKFDNPTDLVLNSAGVLFVMDEDNNRIRKAESQPSFYIAPALAAGLNFNQNTGEISGTPTTDFNQTYVVSTQNNCGTVSTNIQLAASSAPPPTITTQPANAVVCKNGPASFSIVATNAISYVWEVNSGAGWSALTNTAPFSGTPTATLNISTATGLNGNQYRCVVSSGSSTVTSTAATLLASTTAVVTNGNNSGLGTLRDAIACVSAGDTIRFASGVSQVNITSELVITQNIVIDGGSSLVTVRRQSGTNVRIFNINTVNMTVLRNLIITNGSHNSQAGGIQNGGKLTLINCTISGNSSPQANGIENDNILILDRCLLIDNIGNSGGGGMVIFGASTTIKNSVISGNRGGGIRTGSSSNQLIVENSLIFNNTGDGINFGGAAGSTIYNSVFAANTQDGLKLGGSAANMKVVNSIFSQNTGFDISGSSGLGSASTNNLVESTNSGGLVNGVNGNKVGVSPQFLNVSDPDGADNIFFTTDDGYSLTTSSPAFNAGTNTAAPAVDIVGNVRPFNSGIADMGAYELQAALPVVTNQPTDKAVCGTSATSFSVTATFAVSYQWQVKVGAGAFTNLTNGGVYSNVTSATMNISNVSGLSGNQYRCVVTNGVGSVNSNAATLATVAATLTLTNPANNISGDAGTLKAQNTIAATNLISATGKAIFETSKSITLNPGFSAANGAVFTAKINQNVCQ